MITRWFEPGFCALVIFALAVAVIGGGALPEGGRPQERAKVTVRGRVFVDENQNRSYDAGEMLIAGVPVSDQSRRIATGADGTYSFACEPGPGPSISIEIPSSLRLDGMWYVPPFSAEAAGATLEIDFPLLAGGLATASPTTVLAIQLPRLAKEDDWYALSENLKLVVENERPDMILAWTPLGDFDEASPVAARLRDVVQAQGPAVRWVCGYPKATPETDRAFAKHFGPRRYSTRLGAKRYFTTDGDILNGGGRGDLTALSATTKELGIQIVATSGTVAKTALGALTDAGAEIVIAPGPGSNDLVFDKTRLITLPEFFVEGDPDRRLGFALLHVEADGAVNPEVFVPEDAPPASAPVSAEAAPESAPAEKPASAPAPKIDEAPRDTAISETLDAHPFVKGSLKAALEAALR